MLWKRLVPRCSSSPAVFFVNDTATTEIYTLSLHDALPIFTYLSKSHHHLAAASRLFAWLVITSDRKSTRLNSSHANTSYAVFCMKKKNGSKISPVLANDTASSFPATQCFTIGSESYVMRPVSPEPTPFGYTWPMAMFFFNDTATTDIYTLSLHDALPILLARGLFTNPPTCRSTWFQYKEPFGKVMRSEEHTSELQSRQYLVCRLLLE